MQTAYINGTIFDGKSFRKNRVLLVTDNQVTSFIDRQDIPKTANVYDLQGGILAPGFIDVQVNGGGGVMFNDSPSSTIQTIVASHRKYGTTTLFPTLISTDWKNMVLAAGAIKQAIKNKTPGIRGIHFEGPYLNKTRKGVHDEGIIRLPDKGAVDLLTSDDMGLVLTTLAPENVPVDFIKKLNEAGVIVCAGHSAATYEEMIEGFNHGIKGITHLFNAMSPFESRKPGVVGAALENSSSWCGIIVDGYHSHPASLRVATEAKAKGKMMLITDAMATVGAKDKRFMLNNEEIVAKNGRCATSGGVLAGSDLDMAAAVRNTISLLDQPVEEALRMASLYPAQFLGLDNILGRISPGYQADLVHLSKELQPVKTWIGGKE